MNRVNVDYIGVVRTAKDGNVVFTKVPITNEYQELLGTLKDMVSNRNMTVLDMQGHFDREFRCAPRGFNYCHPWSYSTSYIGGAGYPTSYTYQEYQNKLRDCDNEEQMSQSLKRAYEKEAIRYIQAFCYHRELQLLKQDDNNRMFSSENIGWTDYVYDLNNDVQFRLKTNFGYGMSSYFFVNLTYKGIDILPYSMMVSYYYANMADIIRYTRMYDPKPDSWNIALDFVARTTNEAATDTSSFVRKWITNEIQMMMAGLKRFAQNPSMAFSIIRLKKQIDGLITIRNINQSEEAKYKVYPHEMEIAKQAEKISGALDFLSNLEALSDLFPEVAQDIQMIKDLNIGLLPSFIRKIEEIGAEVERRQIETTQLEDEIETLERFCKPHNDAIMELKKEKENETGKYVPEYEVREKYCKEHHDYKQKYDKLNELQNKVREKKDDIWNRKNFVMQIESCVDKIRTTLQLSA